MLGWSTSRTEQSPHSDIGVNQGHRRRTGSPQRIVQPPTPGPINTKVTDAGLKQLKALTNLRSLYLIGTQVTDAGLEHLHKLTTLRQLCLGATR